MSVTFGYNGTRAHKPGRGSLLALGIALLTISGLITVPALADSHGTQAVCNHEQHCYGTIRWTHGNVNGAEVELGTYRLAPADPTANFATSEFWLGFDGTTSLWLEYGIIHGIWCNSRMQWFSAINRTSGFTLQCHGAASESNTKHVLRAEEPFNGTWNLYRNGSHVTGYGNAPSGTAYLDVGHEVTSSDPVASMTGGKLRFRYESTGAWANGWASPSYPAGNPAPDSRPCYSLWAAKPTDMRARCNMSALAEAPRAASLPPAQEVIRLASLLGKAATSARELTPMKTSHRAALRELAINEDSERPALVYRLDGDFVGTSLPRPQGTEAPQARSLTAVFDEASGDLLAVHLSADAES